MTARRSSVTLFIRAAESADRLIAHNIADFSERVAAVPEQFVRMGQAKVADKYRKRNTKILLYQLAKKRFTVMELLCDIF